MPKFSDDQVLAAVRDAWRIASTTASGLSSNRYQELVHDGSVAGPSAVRVLQRYGTWAAATAAAGVPAGRRPRLEYSTAWSDADMLAHVRAYLDDPQASGSYAGWDSWRRELAPQAPSGPTLRNRLGSWSQIRERARALPTPAPSTVVEGA